MKNFKLLLLSFLFVSQIGVAQHFIPVDLLVDAKNINVSLYGGFSVDGGNGTDMLSSLSNTAQSGFIVNALYRVNDGGTATFHQFLIDLNPIIINWNPFTWNKLVKQPVDSFSNYKLPFQEDAVLHIGWHKNWITKFERSRDQYQHVMLFGEIYYRPYNIFQTVNTVENNYRFQVFNVNTGIQYSFLKAKVPTLGNFLIGATLQMNFLLTNESDNYIGSLAHLMPGKGKNFMGPGAKIVVQTNFLNIYIEGRQYYGLDANYSGEKFTQEPIILVGAFGNIKWTNKKNSNNNSNNNNGE